MSNIQVINLNKSFKQTQALKNVNLSFDEKQIYGLLGRNGAGKTTLLNIISNRIFATSGQVVINDRNHLNIHPQLSSIYIAGEDNLFPEGAKVKEIFEWTKEFFPNFNSNLAKKMAASFELSENKKVKSLSTGYQTILKDIVALCVNTEFVFFDEPVLGLDANHRDMFYRYLIECYSDSNSTFVVSTHLIDEVANIIEHVIIIDQGQIIKNTSREELLSLGYTVSGKKEDVDAFVKDMNVIGEDILGNMKATYVLSDTEIDYIPNTIEISKINLQKLFVELTKKEAVK